jgi:hypothetical protein
MDFLIIASPSLTLNIGEWGTQAVLPPMAELQATLVDEVRSYLQHLENAIITLHKVQQRNIAVLPLLQAHDAPSSPRSPKTEVTDNTGIPNFFSSRLCSGYGKEMVAVLSNFPKM